jgi:hypothetical protein
MYRVVGSRIAWIDRKMADAELFWANKTVFHKAPSKFPGKLMNLRNCALSQRGDDD